MSNHKNDVFILGAGITGLAAGYISGLPVLEANEFPGGICSSYYMGQSSKQHFHEQPEDQEAYRFEYGGGHWIFGGDPTIIHFIKTNVSVKTYNRESSVFFPNEKRYVPYPLQNNLRYLNEEIRKKALSEIVASNNLGITLKESLESSFGKTLCNLFFHPFHDLYTAGLYKTIAPQDSYKTPVNISLVELGAKANTPAIGYNISFIYPEYGLNSLTAKLANKCLLNYNKKITSINVNKKTIYFNNGEELKYSLLLSTLPLNKCIEMTSFNVGEPDPYTSVLVLNIGAVKGKHCPNEHWIYIPTSKSGFHRVGFYSNVDRSFLPKSSRDRNDKVSLYIERAFSNGSRPTASEIDIYVQSVIKELQDWEYIEEAEVVDPTWIDVAYTWKYPKSTWREKALKILEENDIYQIGRYARWTFQGIADSIKDGFYAGAAFR